MERYSSRYFLALLSGLTFSACGTGPDTDPSAAVDAQQAAIIYGSPATLGTYPSTGALLIREYGLRAQVSGSLCTGTLIAPDTVLTAAHCLGDDSQERHFFFTLESNVKRVMGSADVPDSPIYHAAVAAKPHPSYSTFARSGLQNAHDIALVFLAEPILDVQPAKLLHPAERKYLNVDTPLDIVGYGLRTPPEYGLQDNDELGEKYYAHSKVGELGAYELQAGKWPPTPQKCHGDSGGPSFINTPYGSRLVGVTSRAYDSHGCTRGGVDTRPDAYLRWIKDVMETACNEGVRKPCYPLQ